MNKNPMRKILDIRVVREEQASREFRKKKRAVEDALEVLQQRMEEEAAFAKLLIARENAFVDVLIENSIPMSEVKTMRRELESWRHRRGEFQAAVDVERKNVVKAEEACAKARVEYQAKAKEKMKTETFSDTWDKQAAKEAEAREEIELEDRIQKKSLVTESTEDD